MSAQINGRNPPHRSVVWYLLLASILIAGAALLGCSPSSLDFLARVSVRIKPDAGGRFVGIVLTSAVLSHILIYWAMRGIHHLFSIGQDYSQNMDVDAGTNLWPQAILGILEGGLYVVALIKDKPEFIGFWIAVKTAGGWVAWSGTPEQKDQAELNRARRRFYSFLIGNALAIIAALTTFGVLKLHVLQP